MTPSARIVAYGSSGLLVLGGALVALPVEAIVGFGLAFILIANGLLLATALVCGELRVSEDRAAEREPQEQIGRPSGRRRLRSDCRLGRERDHPRRRP